MNSDRPSRDHPTMVALRVLRAVAALSLVATLALVPLTVASPPAPHIVAVILGLESVVGVWWAFALRPVLVLINTYTVALVLLGVLAAASVADSSLAVLVTGAHGIGALALWPYAVTSGPPVVNSRSWRRASAWVVPALAVLGLTMLALSPRRLRLTASKDALDTFTIEQQNHDAPTNPDGCTLLEPARRVGLFTVSAVCFSASKVTWLRTSESSLIVLAPPRSTPLTSENWQYIDLT